MRLTRCLVTLVALAALVTGCSGGQDRPRNESRQSSSPTQSREVAPISQAAQDKLAGFLNKAEPVDEGGLVGPRYELLSVHYTSPTDAAAEIYDHTRDLTDSSIVIATTDDNWAHASGLSISYELADLVDYTPLGRGAVAIMAEDQFPRRSYPPFVLYPDGTVKPLRVSPEPRAVDVDSELLTLSNEYVAEKIGLDPTLEGIWMLGVDLDAAEVFGLPPLPLQVYGLTLGDVPGREGLINVAGYLGIGDGVWRFSVSTDNAHTWGTTDVPLTEQQNFYDNGAVRVAVGPGQSQAVARLDDLEDPPYYLGELWVTDDEKAFDRVRLPWDRMVFGGMVFASDGALLVSEPSTPDEFCTDTCRPGRVSRLPPGGTELAPLAGAPRVAGSGISGGMYYAGGGVIVVHTGKRTIAVSTDGRIWSEVKPER